MHLPDPVGLPGHFYTDPDVFKLEQAELLPDSWQIVGRESQLPKPGDFLTTVLGNEPVIVTRTQEGDLRALINLCLHRGTRLIEDATGNCDQIRCPYHGWTYTLSGSLKAVPYKRCIPDLNSEELSLHQAQLATWGGFIFVRINHTEASFSQNFHGIVKRWEQYPVEWEQLEKVAENSFEDRFNWKIFNENFIDYYHVPFIHPESLDMPEKVGNEAYGNHFATTIYQADGRTNLFDLIFPNMFFHVSRRQVQFYRVLALDPDHCRIELTCYQTPKQQEEFPLSSDQHRDIEQILGEDFGVCRTLQKQAASKAYRVCFTAREYEEGVTFFQQTIHKEIDRLRSK